MSDKRISAATAKEFGVCWFTGSGFSGMSARDIKDGAASRSLPGRYPRLVFPLRNLYGSLVGVAYRSENVKFMYDKGWDVRPSEMLYGLHLTHEEIRKRDSAIIVEGAFDFLRLYDVGIRNVVSTLGARLSWTQMCLLRRFCSSVFICYDPDAAGRSATRRAVDMLRKGGLHPVPVDVPADPDDYVNVHGAGGFLELCFQSLNDTGSGLNLRI